MDQTGVAALWRDHCQDALGSGGIDKNLTIGASVISATAPRLMLSFTRLARFIAAAAIAAMRSAIAATRAGSAPPAIQMSYGETLRSNRSIQHATPE